MQILNYVQLVWDLIITENNLNKNTEIYHGAVEAIYTVIGKFCVCVLCPSYITFTDKQTDMVKLAGEFWNFLLWANQTQKQETLCD